MNHKNYLETFLSPDHPYLLYCGRIGTDDFGYPEFVYPCSFVRLTFTGNSIAVLIENHPVYWNHFIGWILDGKQEKIHLEQQGTVRLNLGENLDSGRHSLLLFKRQDSCHTFSLKGFLLAEDGLILVTEPLPDRKIEVYGDSVSAGEVSEAIEYVEKEDPVHHGEYSNSWYSYSWMLARKLNACIHNVSQGGIALMNGTGWFEQPESIGMENIYDKIQYHPALGRSCTWNFTKYRPHIIIIAIGQNDNHPFDFMKEDYCGPVSVTWRKHYQSFINRLRIIYPLATIILTTTILNHDESWDKAIEEVAESLHDRCIHHFLYSKNGCGTPGHIRIPEAEIMAEELSVFIDRLGVEIWN